MKSLNLSCFCILLLLTVICIQSTTAVNLLQLFSDRENVGTGFSDEFVKENVEFFDESASAKVVFTPTPPFDYTSVIYYVLAGILIMLEITLIGCFLGFIVKKIRHEGWFFCVERNFNNGSGQQESK